MKKIISLLLFTVMMTQSITDGGVTIFPALVGEDFKYQKGVLTFPSGRQVSCCDPRGVENAMIHDIRMGLRLS